MICNIGHCPVGHLRCQHCRDTGPLGDETRAILQLAGPCPFNLPDGYLAPAVPQAVVGPARPSSPCLPCAKKRAALPVPYEDDGPEPSDPMPEGDCDC